MITLMGIDRFILSPLEYKRVLLTSQLCLIFVCSLIFFTILDQVSGFSFSLPYNLASMALGIFALILNRSGAFMTARVLLTLTVTSEAIFFACVTHRDAGIFLLALSINLGIMAGFGYEKIRWVIMMMVLSTAGFLVAMFHPYPRIPLPADPSYVARNLVICFLVASLTSALIVYYLLRANDKVEAILFTKEEDLRIKNQELVRINSELDKFFYSASHDLRAPLTSIKGMIGLMEMCKDPSEMKEYVQLLKGRTQNLEHFIRRISEYSNNSQREVLRERVRLRGHLSEILENFRFYPHAEKIKIHLEVPPEIEVVTDAARLQVIFGNLISNAIKYHDFRKPDPWIRIASQRNDLMLQVVIEDNGLGIPEEHLPRIFGMFYRAHRQTEGTGLGLYIVQETLEKLGGAISVSSTTESGTAFTVSLPVK